jgi:hypothetical protein
MLYVEFVGDCGGTTRDVGGDDEGAMRKHTLAAIFESPFLSNSENPSLRSCASRGSQPQASSGRKGKEGTGGGECVGVGEKFLMLLACGCVGQVALKLRGCGCAVQTCALPTTAMQALACD